MGEDLSEVLQCGAYFPATVKSIFHAADANGDGVVSGQEAVAFFVSTGLKKEHLSQVWEAATASQPGGLTLPQFSRALRLVSLLQVKCVFNEEYVAKALHPQTGLHLPTPKIGQRYLEGVDGSVPSDGSSPARAVTVRSQLMLHNTQAGSCSRATAPENETDRPTRALHPVYESGTLCNGSSAQQLHRTVQYSRDPSVSVQHTWAIAPQYIEQFRLGLSIFQVSVPTIRSDCAPLLCRLSRRKCSRQCPWQHPLRQHRAFSKPSRRQQSRSPSQRRPCTPRLPRPRPSEPRRHRGRTAAAPAPLPAPSPRPPQAGCCAPASALQVPLHT